MKTIVGLYDDITTARRVVEELAASGFERADISLVANNQLNGTTTAAGATGGDGEAMAEGVAGGALVGGALGGLGGLVLGLGALAIPGIGPVVAAGPIVAGLTGVGIGAAVGGLAGALVNWGVPQKEAEFYATGVRRGGTLVAVKSDDSRVDEALRIMNQFGRINVEQMGNGHNDAWFRGHFDQTYGSRGYTFDRYQPAYTYGSGLANEQRFYGRDWTSIETDVRRDWESRNSGPWEEFKDAVRYGWENVKDAARDAA